MLIDTHCHIQDEDYSIDSNIVMENALNSGVSRAVVVGTDLESSRRGIEFAEKYSNITGTKSEAYAVIGVHPSNANLDYQDLESIYENTPISLRKRIIGVGEIGLDYHYAEQSKKQQIEALEWQIDFALRRNLSIEFHVRDAFDDFWAVLNNFKVKNADIHSFTDSPKNAEEALARGYYIGLNGISTFTKINWQRDLYTSLPMGSILFETDAPFLTPAPFRGKINEPARIKQIAEYHANARGVSLDEIAEITSQNFKMLFNV